MPNKNYVATNENFVKAYNDYLKENNLTQAETSIYAKLGGEVFPVSYDMFFDFLINKIVLSVVTNHEFIDPLASLYGSSLPVGQIIEDKRTVLEGIDSEYSTQEFETDVSNPFIKKKSGISVVYHKVNVHKKIKRTVSHQQIQEALLTEGGIQSLVDAIINDIQVEKDAYLYRDKKNALQQPDYLTFVDYDDYADFNIKVKNIFVDMKNFDNSYKYNAGLLYSPTNDSNILIIMSEKYKNEQDVKYFTGLFNKSYADIMGNFLFIDEFDDPNIKAIIVDRRGIFFRKSLDTVRPLINPDDLTENRTYHFWRMHSVSPHYSAVAIRKKDDTVENVSLTWEGNDTEVETSTLLKKGGDIKFTLTGEQQAYYTTDGSEPTTSSKQVNSGESINVNKSMVIKVMTTTNKAGKEQNSPQATKVYRIRYIG